MSLLDDWLNVHARPNSVPLLREEGGVVSTIIRGGMRKLERPASTAAFKTSASLVPDDMHRYFSSDETGTEASQRID